MPSRKQAVQTLDIGRINLSIIYCDGSGMLAEGSDFCALPLVQV